MATCTSISRGTEILASGPGADNRQPETVISVSMYLWNWFSMHFLVCIISDALTDHVLLMLILKALDSRYFPGDRCIKTHYLSVTYLRPSFTIYRSLDRNITNFCHHLHWSVPREQSCIWYGLIGTRARGSWIVNEIDTYVKFRLHLSAYSLTDTMGLQRIRSPSMDQWLRWRYVNLSKNNLIWIRIYSFLFITQCDLCLRSFLF